MTQNWTVEKQHLHLFNTLTRDKQRLLPLEDGHVKIYTCGPTVYNFAHIGNFRTYVFEDLLRRAVQFFGFKVTQVMNLTDVDDKTIRGAIANKVTLDEFTKPFIAAFFEDLKTLHIQPAEHYPAATDYIPHMIKMIEELLEKQVAYKGGDGSVYFAIRRFPKYGCLSHFHLDELEQGASERVDHDEYEKESASDFVLWKAYDPLRDGSIYWESPFGKGRPGWHLECSAMAMSLLGTTLDIHVGGVDNMFPHHENEIAQSESCSGTTFSKMWLHAEHLIVDNKKMSKSLGNFYTLRDLLAKGFSGKQVRFLLLQTHYKTQLNFTFQGLEAAKSTLQRLQDFIVRLFELQEEGVEKKEDGLKAAMQKAFEGFSEALGDDLNISQALASLFDFVREVNGLIDEKKLSSKDAADALGLLKRFDEVLGVLEFEKLVEEVPKQLQDALTKRLAARAAKDWALADQLREEIHEAGYVIEDTPTGVRLKKLEEAKK